MHQHCNTGESSRDALILACDGHIRALAWKYADGSYEQFEELYSIGTLALCEAVASMPAGFPEPAGYLYKAAQHDMIDELKRLRRLSVVSLDAPLSSDGSYSLADVLPSPTLVLSSGSKRARAVNDALFHLTARQRAVIRRRHGLAGYGASSLKETASSLHITVNAVDSADRAGLRSLGRDYRLCSVVEVKR